MTKKQRAKPVRPKVKKIALEPGEALHVAIPEDHMPVVVSDAAKVEIVPVKKQSWWDYLFGPEEERS